MTTAPPKHTAKQKPRILFIHNTVAPYTKPFFLGLSQIYDIQFVFTDMQLGKDLYRMEMRQDSDVPGGIAYQVRRRYFRSISPSGIPLGLIADVVRERFDVLVATLGTVEMVLCFKAAKLKRKPLILINGVWGWEGKLQERDLGSTFARFIVPHTDAVTVPGTKHKEYVVALGAHPDKVFITPYASNMVVSRDDYEEVGRLKETLKIGPKKVILYVGRLVKQKGVDYLLEAFARLRREREDVFLLVVGEGDARIELERLAGSLGIEDSVCFSGFVSNEKLAAYYLMCDVCVVPSITHGQADVWVRAVNDAMRAGKPVVATDAVGAAFDMIRNGENGFIVPERDSQALYQAISKIISEPGLAERMGQEAKRTIEQGFEYEHMINGFCRAVDTVLRSRHKNKPGSEPARSP